MKTFLIALMLMQGTVGMPPQGKNSLMILPFEAATAGNEYQSLENGIPDILMACLSAHSDSIQVLDRSHLNSLAQELGLVYEASMSREGVAQIGRLASAQFILTGSFWVKKETLEIQMLIHETETTRLIGSTDLRVPVDSLASSCGSVAKKISVQFEKNKQSPFHKLDAETHPEMSNHMIQGLGFYYNGEFWKAFPAFLKVLEMDPNHANARFWLGQSYMRAGMSDLAKLSLEEFVRRFPKHAKWKEAKRLIKEADHEKH
jgi:tetratricopeptide (TPR) repeat protein